MCVRTYKWAALEDSTPINASITSIPSTDPNENVMLKPDVYIDTSCYNPLCTHHIYALQTVPDSLLYKALCSAVLDVDYSPTGKEFVSGSYDKSLRIFPCETSRSRY